MVSLNSQFYPNGIIYSLDTSQVTLIKQTWYARYGKRVLDVSIAFVVTVLILSWMVPVLGAAICLTSPGPALFLQKRTGRNGRVFWCLKFRTMYHVQKQVFEQACEDDPRVTRLGKYLRRTNLDEMPQFLNVLLGDMSLIGPRPHAIEHDYIYWQKLDRYHLRYTVRPGITGLAQVRGARGDTSALIKMQHRLRYDLHYMRKQSFILDIWLLWLTLKQMIVGAVNAW